MQDLDFKYLTIIGAGLLAAFLLSPTESRNWRVSLGAFCAGIMCAVLLPEPTMHLLAWDPEIFGYPLAGYFALFGDRMVRRVFALIDEFKLPWKWGK